MGFQNSKNSQWNRVELYMLFLISWLKLPIKLSLQNSSAISTADISKPFLILSPTEFQRFLLELQQGQLESQQGRNNPTTMRIVIKTPGNILDSGETNDPMHKQPLP